MDKSVEIMIDKFYITLKDILGEKIEDIIVHGSTIGGEFIHGKGDIDFIVILTQNVSDVEYSNLISYHHNTKQNKNLESQLEGSYLVISKDDLKISNGIYIGSTESRWKRFEGDIFTSLDKALIKEVSYSLMNKRENLALFDYQWEEVISEIKQNTGNTLELLDKITDNDFKLYALHTVARSFYTYKNRAFISKIMSLDMLTKDSNFNEFHEFLSKIKKYKSILSEEENNEMNKLDLFQINRIVRKIKVMMN